MIQGIGASSSHARPGITAGDDWQQRLASRVSINTDAKSPQAMEFFQQASHVVPTNDWLGNNIDITA